MSMSASQYHEVGEQAVRRQRRVCRLQFGPLDEPRLQRTLGGRGGGAGALHLPRLAVPVTVGGARLEPARRQLPDGDVTDGPDGQPWPRHQITAGRMLQVADRAEDVSRTEDHHEK